MSLITVTIDLRDLDRTLGPPPLGAKITFARLSPTEDAGTLISTRPVAVPLTDGHGTVQLQADTGYLVGCYSVPGFSRFAVRTGTAATTLGALWRTGQIDPDGFAARPVPQTVEQALAAQAASVAATYVTYDGSNLRLNGVAIPIGGGGGGSASDNGLGGISFSSGATDNGLGGIAA